MLKYLRAHWGLPFVLVLLGATLFLARRMELYQAVEYKALDWRFRHFCDPSRHDPSIVLAMLDQASLDHFEKEMLPWPWPRSMYAAALDFLRLGPARAVVFDVLFTSPSPYGQTEDEALAKALRRTPRAILAADLGRAPHPLRARPPPERFALNIEGPAPAVVKRSARLPIPELLEATHGIGDVSIEPDIDGIFRRVPPLSEMGGRAYPTLPMAVVMAATGARKAAVKGKILSVAGIDIPLTDGKLLLKFHGSALAPSLAKGKKTYEAYSLGNIILSWQRLQEGQKPLYEPSLFKDKIVLIGYSAPGLLDNRPSPISPIFPGTEILAVAADNILNRDFLLPVKAWLALLVLLASVALGAGCALIKRLAASIAALALLSAGFLGASILAFKRGLWLDLAGPELGLVLSFALASAYSYVTEGKKKRFLQGAFALYLSPQLVDQIVAEPERLRLTGERKEVTIFFSDIEGFTTLSETLEPERLAQVINRYLTVMTDIILDLGGTVDKYEGDAIMAFWGAPLAQPDHALRACRAAIQNQRRMEELRKEFMAQGLPYLRIRIGVNSGLVSVGNMGSSKKFAYTVMGDSVNLASRLEGVNKKYGTGIMISESTRRLAGEAALETRELDFIKVKGKNIPIRVYELIAMKGEADGKALRAARLFEEGLALYRQRKWEEAVKALESLLKDRPEDAPAALFIERCRRYQESPPPEDWDGSLTLTEK